MSSPEQSITPQVTLFHTYDIGFNKYREEVQDISSEANTIGVQEDLASDIGGILLAEVNESA